MHRTLNGRPRRRALSGLRGFVFGGLAVAWYAVTTFAPLGIPNFAVVVGFGLLVMLSVEPDSRSPHRGVALSARNLVLAGLAVVAFVLVAAGMDLLLGVIPIESGHAVLATSAAVCVVLARPAQVRDFPAPASLGHRELIISVTALVAAARSYHAGDLWLAMVAFTVVTSVVMLVRRIRCGACSPRRLRSRRWAAQAGNLWLFLALLAAAGLSGTFFVWRIVAPDAWALVLAAFWGGLAAMALLAAFPRPRISAAANVLALLGSVFLVVQLVAISRAPADPVRIGVPFTEEWHVANGGRSSLISSHWPLGVQRDAIDLVQLADGKTFRGDRSALENFHIFGSPLLAVADGYVTAAVDSRPDEPVGGHTWTEMAGNHVILDIGGGRYVLYGHLEQGSLRVGVGDHVRRGQVIGQVGDSGNSDEPHLHIQVQNKPTFDVEDRDIRTYPILFDGATISDLRRGDAVRPVTP
jgi:hypothetical protein